MTLEATEEALVKPLEHSIRLSVYEGPLDLLLFLIRKNEIDIYDIPIESVTRQYLEILHDMEKLNLEVAGEFFVMAATLMHIKSRLLLPKNEQFPEGGFEEDEEVDPRWELVHQLMEYKKFKEAASNLGDLMAEAQKFLPRHYVEVKEDKLRRPLRESDKIEVWNIFNQVLRRLAEKITIGLIQDERITIADRMEHILDTLKEKDRFLFTDLFPDQNYSLAVVVATFLAILELTRLKKLQIVQNVAFGDIECAGAEISP